MRSTTTPEAAGHAMAGVENFAPAEIAQLVETKGVTKANAAGLTTFVLGIVAGAFIALGGVLSTIIATGSAFGFGPTRFCPASASRSA